MDSPVLGTGHARRRARWGVAVTTAAVMLGMVVATVVPTASASADTAPTVPSDPRTPETVSTDSLPVPQLGDGSSDALNDTKGSGVVWDQVVIGDTVYVGGNFQSARPAGAGPGQGVVGRKNFLAYDLKSGALLDFAPAFNAQVRSLAASPDGKRLYVAGSFTSVSGQTRYRLAAFDVASGALVSSFAPYVDASVNTVSATSTAVYVGGVFASVQKSQRVRVAALSAVDASVLPWAPAQVDNEVRALVVSPDEKSVVIGGKFTTVNGTSSPGMAKVMASTGASEPWAATSVIKNGGQDTAIYSLAVSGDSVYGTGYWHGFTNPGNFEGTFRASWSDGSLTWMTDCHGDTYSVAVAGDVVYSTSHAHYCAGIGGFPEGSTSVTAGNNHPALAYSNARTGTIKPNTESGYHDFTGQPAPSLLDWYPDLQPGNFTGATQAAWDVAAAGDYVLLGGEFTRVNGVKQFGLARFAKKSVAPNKDKPQLEGAQMKPTLHDYGTGTVRLSWAANYDRDNARLTYQVIQDGNTGQPAATEVVESRFWQRPTVSATVSGLTIGRAYEFRIRTVDPFGNVRWGDPVTVTTTGMASTALSDYDRKIVADGARSYWPFNESTGATAVDVAGANDLGFASAVTRDAAGVPAAGNTGSQFAGTSASYGASTVAEAGRQVFTVESWVRTSSRTGGQIMGFASTRGTSSPLHDRKVWMGDDGTITFGAYPGAIRTVTSKQAYNDGKWHHVVSTLGANGMQLIVDGVTVGSDGRVTSSADYPGYWNVGGNDNTWTGHSTNGYFPGVIDNVAVYDRALSPEEARAHFELGGSGTIPMTSYDTTVLADKPATYWPMSENVSRGSADVVGTNDLGMGSTITRGAAGVEKSGVATSFAGASGSYGASTVAEAGSQVFTVESWVRTSSKTGGQIMGFASTRGTSSPLHDRKVWMGDDGTITFGAYPGAIRTVTSKQAYNDGKWHHVVSTLGANGMQLIVDGVTVGSDGRVTSSADYPGYWNVGGNDNTWTGHSTNGYFPGDIDNVAVYDRVLSASQIKAHQEAASGVTPNRAPSSSFSSSVTDMTVSVDGSGSTDADGSVASYAWDFGDGASASGQKASHAYKAAGRYTVKLTVTDDRGASNTSSATVTIAGQGQPEPAALASDTFDRTDPAGWGSAGTGGSWKQSGSAGGLSVADGSGLIRSAKGESRVMLLPATSAGSDSRVSFRVEQAASGGGQYLVVIGRQVGTDSYSARVWIQPGGVLQLQVRQGASTLKAVNLPGTYTLGQPVHVRVEVTGQGTTTVNAKAWTTGAEPEAWQASATDSTPALQMPGSVGLSSYLSASATAATVFRIDDYVVTTT